MNFTRLWERKVAKYFRTVFQYLFHHGEFTKVQTVLPKFFNCQNIVLKKSTPFKAVTALKTQNFKNAKKGHKFAL